MSCGAQLLLLAHRKTHAKSEARLMLLLVLLQQQKHAVPRLRHDERKPKVRGAILLRDGT